MRNQGTLARMGDEIARGAEIKRRREALRIANLRQFRLATGRDYDTLKRAEEGRASATTMDWLEDWLTKREAEGAVPVAEESESIRIEMHDVYGIGGFVVTAPIDHPDEAAEAVAKILDTLKQRGVSDPE